MSDPFVPSPCFQLTLHRASGVMIVMLTAMLSIGVVRAQTDDGSAAASMRPLGDILTAEGTIRAGAEGSFDATGFALARGDGGSQPHFVPSSGQTTASPGAWDNRYGTPTGMDAQVHVIAVHGNVVYAGGAFTTATGALVNGIAKWNGVMWTALGSGAVGTVRAIAPSSTGDTVYVGGTFMEIGGISAPFIARWINSTQTWSALGSTLTTGSGVYAIAQDGGYVYVGGSFTKIGNLLVRSLARFNLALGTWEKLGTTGLSTNGNIYAMTSVGSTIYVAGSFTSVNNVAAVNIAKWNGSTWSSVGSSGYLSNGPAYAVASDGTSLYVGGMFLSRNYIAKVDLVSQTWSTLGQGVGGNLYALNVDNAGHLYAGGIFIEVDGSTPANYLARWDGTSWSAIGAGTASTVRCLASVGDTLFVGGEFTTVDTNLTANFIAKCRISTQEWSVFGNGLNQKVNAVLVTGADFYVGGAFTAVGGINASYLAKWSGTTNSWSPVGGGVDGEVLALATDGMGTIFAGGRFTTVGTSSLAANYVASWNGTAWSAMGSMLDGAVHALAWSGGRLYVGGEFTSPHAYIARWDSTGWSALGSGTNATVLTLAVHGGVVYAGGEFSAPDSYLAAWNGIAWSSVGAPLAFDAPVRALSVDATGNLYTGGDFSMPASHLARFDGQSWSGLTDASTSTEGTDGSVHALLWLNGSLYAGGQFTSAGGVPVGNLAVFDGSNWVSMGGTTGLVAALARMSGIPKSSGVSRSTTADRIIVGGDFLAVDDTGMLGAGYVASYEAQGVLPVELTDFSAVLRNERVMLRWCTATESNNHGFEIERREVVPFEGAVSLQDDASSRGGHPAGAQNRATEKDPAVEMKPEAESRGWLRIGFVPGWGTASSTHHYTFEDDLTMLDRACRIVEYRLRQQDRDGSFSLSPVLTVMREDGPECSLSASFPIPAFEQSSVMLRLLQASSITAHLYSSDGRLMRRIAAGLELAAGMHLLTVPRDGCPPGLYFLVVDTGTQRMLQRVIFH